MEIKDDILFFESDDEFADVCIAPYAVVVIREDGMPTICSDYSDIYKRCIEEGKTFIIMDVDSKVYRRHCVCKRVPVKIKGDPAYSRDILVQLDVENLEDYDDYLFEEKIRNRRLGNDNIYNDLTQ